MLPLREYLAQRRADIQAQVKALRLELNEIEAAERGLADAPAKSAGRRERGSAASGKKTLKELAIEALRGHPSGAEATTIIADIKAAHGIEIKRESLSPQLSRLGHEGILTRTGLYWRLTDLGAGYAVTRNDETPDGATSGVSESEEEIDDEIPF